MMTTHGIGHNSGDARPFNENSAPKGADTKPTPDTANPITSIPQGDIKPTGQSDDELAASAQRHFAVADQHKLKSREELYLGLGDLYRIYAKNYPNRRKREEFERIMFREKLPMKRFILAIFVVRYFGNITDKGTASRYAVLLRKAHSANVPPQGIVRFITNRMNKLRESKTYQRRHENRDDKAADTKQSTKRLRDHDETKRAHRRRQTASSEPRATLILEKDTEKKFHNAKAKSSLWIRVRKTDNHTAHAREVRSSFPGTSMKRS